MIDNILATLANWIIAVISSSGYLGIFLLMTVESAGILAPSEVIMPFSGFLSLQGTVNFWLVVLSGTTGNLIGSLIAYWIGFVGGRPLIARYGKYIFLSDHELGLAERFFVRSGNLTVFVGRLLPVIRTYISFPAGAARMPIKPFIFYTTIGAFVWSVFLAEVGVKLGQNWEDIRHYGRGLDAAILILIIAAISYFVISRRKK